jgi:hypothetical protein
MATIIIPLVFCFSIFLSSVPAYSAVFNIASGDVTGLIAAINAANSNGEENTINLEPGTYTLTAIDNGTIANFSSTGLPIITSAMTITGAGMATTIIERDANAPSFRILRVEAAGTLTLQGLTLSGGNSLSSGGGISNVGTLTLIDCTLTGNRASGTSASGGGISNGGTLTLIGRKLCSGWRRHYDQPYYLREQRRWKCPPWWWWPLQCGRCECDDHRFHLRPQSRRRSRWRRPQ